MVASTGPVNKRNAKRTQQAHHLELIQQIRQINFNGLVIEPLGGVFLIDGLNLDQCNSAGRCGPQTH
jgi:hypothetical protein